MGRIVILAVMVMGLWATPSQATIFFDDSFETCTVGGGASFPCEGWNDFGQEGPGNLEISNEFPLSGSKTLKMTWPDATGGPSIYKSVPLPGTHIFIRYANRRGSTWAYPTVNGQSKLVIIGNLGYPRSMIVDQSGTYRIVVECPYRVLGTGGAPIASILWDTGFAPRANQYDQVEMEYKLNQPGQADGLIRVWINNALRLERLNLELRGPTPTSVTGSSCGQIVPSTYKIQTIQIYRQGGTGVRHVDRFAVGDTRIGLVGSGGLPDSTPPATPAGWTIH